MTQFDKQLKELHQQLLRTEKINAMLEDLYRQQCSLSRRESDLRAVREAEQRDVDRLEQGSLAAFFYAALGRKEEKLDRERREALAAAVKHDTVLREYNAVRRDIAELEEERDRLNHSAAQYRRVLEEKKAYLIENDPERAAAICRIQEQLGCLKGQQQEVEEALSAGNAALRQIQTVREDLNSAKNWGIFDLVSDGGLVFDLAKYARLDDAQNGISYLQVLLDRFHTELTDVRIDAELQVRPGEFLTFADFFFDNLLADWAVLDHISGAQTQLSQIEAQVQTLLTNLRAAAENLRLEEQVRQGELEEVVVEG